MSASIEVRAAGIRFAFEPRGGLIGDLRVEEGGRVAAPLHKAPWVGTGEALAPDTAPHLARLQGDFFCAPFAGKEDGSHFHGWTANGDWDVLLNEGGLMRAVLRHLVHGATVVKELRVADASPFLYQRHLFVGGEGRLPVANHANLTLPNGGLIRTSEKRQWESIAAPQETDPARGRSALRYPASSADPRAFPAEGGTADLTRYPWNPRHEDFVIGIEARGHRLGWTAVTRPVEGDLYLSLRDARALPMTMLWHSNGGRDYAPWRGRHVAGLGVEEGAAAHMLAVSTEADLSGPGTLALEPDGVAEVRHVIGALPWPSGEPVTEVREEGDAVVVTGEGGASRRLPFRSGFLGAD